MSKWVDVWIGGWLGTWMLGEWTDEVRGLPSAETVGFVFY